MLLLMVLLVTAKKDLFMAHIYLPLRTTDKYTAKEVTIDGTDYYKFEIVEGQEMSINEVVSEFISIKNEQKK